MNKEQFIYWLKGYTAGHEHAPTLKQWETIVSELDKIKDCPDYGSPIGEGGWSAPNTAPIQTLPFIQPYEPKINPYKITSESGTTLTISSGSSGTINIATPGYGSITYNPSSTTYAKPQSGSWHYTSTLPQQPTTGSNQLELDLK
jgi:hypothetical protein